MGPSLFSDGDIKDSRTGMVRTETLQWGRRYSATEMLKNALVRLDELIDFNGAVAIQRRRSVEGIRWTHGK